jgi:hypothetical protein
VSRLGLAATCLVVVGSIIAVPATAWAVPVPWTNCGTAGDAVSVQQFDASVWPPQAGQPLTLTYKWNLTETLIQGSLEHVTTTWPSGRVFDRWLPFQPAIAPLFGMALLGHYSLSQATPPPMPAGPYSQSLTLRVPRRWHATQQIGVDVAGFDAAGHQVMCMQLVIPIK